MQNAVYNREETARRGRSLYEHGIRDRVESEENIGKMVIIDVDTGDYEIDELGFESARRLRDRHPGAHLFGMRIGYNVAESLGGVTERSAPK